MWVNEHKRHNREEENDREHDGDAIEVLLNDARTALICIERAGDHIRNACALARMKQDENDQSSSRNEEQNEQNNQQRTHSSHSISSVCINNHVIISNGSYSCSVSRTIHISSYNLQNKHRILPRMGASSR